MVSSRISSRKSGLKDGGQPSPVAMEIEVSSQNEAGCLEEDPDVKEGLQVRCFGIVLNCPDATDLTLSQPR